MSIGTKAHRACNCPSCVSHSPLDGACALATQDSYISFASISTNNSGGSLVVKTLRQCVLQTQALFGQ